MKKKNLGLIVLIIILSFLVIGLSGYIIYDKFLSNKTIMEQKTENNNTTATSKDEKRILNTEEIKRLETYINNPENNAFVLMEYLYPEEILMKNNIEILKYSINASNFSKNADENQKKIIWEGAESQVSTRVSSIDDLSTYIAEKTGYKISTDKIKNAFVTHLNEELNLYYYLISDTIFREYRIIDGYEIGYRVNKEIHLMLDDNSEVVLIPDNDKYYFYSCKKNK